MLLASKETIKFLCKKYKFQPSRSSGQNFLVSENILNNIVHTAQLQGNDTVLEIGAGFGTLTVELLKGGSKVIAVELDKRLVVPLKKLAKVNKNLLVVEGDIFKQWPAISPKLKDLCYKIVANLPYNITSLVLRNFLEQKPRPKEMILLVQKEVAERVVARPGKMSRLSVAVQFYGQPEIIGVVPAQDFWPMPEVDSAILKIDGIGEDIDGYQGLLGSVDKKKFFNFINLGYSAKRKQLHNNLASGFRLDNGLVQEIFKNIGINPHARAQDLAIEDWIKIVQNIEEGARITI
jgi:16S rRNA (adenine1518-N6/adenine1519-N6)-dimethyltransferase